MGLRERLAAGLRAGSRGWILDYAVFYGLKPGDRLTVVIERLSDAEGFAGPHLVVRTQVVRGAVSSSQGP